MIQSALSRILTFTCRYQRMWTPFSNDFSRLQNSGGLIRTRLSLSSVAAAVTAKEGVLDLVLFFFVRRHLIALLSPSRALGSVATGRGECQQKGNNRVDWPFQTSVKARHSTPRHAASSKAQQVREAPRTIPGFAITAIDNNISVMMPSSTIPSDPLDRAPKVRVGQYVKITMPPQGSPDAKQQQTCCFCGYSKNSIVFQATKWSVHILGCSSAPQGTSMHARARTRQQRERDHPLTPASSSPLSFAFSSLFRSLKS